MPDISHYTDYRKFLQDYYKEKKKAFPGFSFHSFSQKAGLKSKGFLFNVLRGRRNLSLSHILGLVQYIKLGKPEAEYFRNLVAFNQAASPREKEYHYQKLAMVKTSGKNAWQPQIVRQDQFEFYSHLYHSVIRSLVDLYHIKDDDIPAVVKALRFPLPLRQVKKSLRLLERLGFIHRHKNGQYAVCNKSIATPPEVQSLAVINFHRQAGQLALQMLETLPASRRNLSAMTLGISQKTYNEICDDIRELRQNILQKAEADSQADAVYQLNFQFFPVTRSLPKGAQT